MTSMVEVYITNFDLFLCGNMWMQKTSEVIDYEMIFPDLPTFYEINAEDLPPFGKKRGDFYARKI